MQLTKQMSKESLSAFGGKKKVKAEKRETKKKLKMKVSGRSVFRLKEIIHKKARREELIQH